MAALLRVGTKIAIAGGAVYITTTEGVWTSGNFGSKALKRFRTEVLPTANDMVNKLPNCDSVGDTVVNSWNRGVSATFSTLAESPQLALKYGTEYGSKGVEYIREKIK